MGAIFLLGRERNIYWKKEEKKEKNSRPSRARSVNPEARLKRRLCTWQMRNSSNCGVSLQEAALLVADQGAPAGF